MTDICLATCMYVGKSDWGWQIDPVGLRYAMNLLYERHSFIYVDKDNEGKGSLERRRKKSFHWYLAVKK